MLIQFGNNQFLLNPDGSMFWLEEKSLIVGDLHLEKSTSYIDQGNFLPPYDTIDTLERLLNITKELLPNRIIFLGDVFHDNLAFDRLKTKEKKLFKDLIVFSRLSKELFFLIFFKDSFFSSIILSKTLVIILIVILSNV